MKTIDDRKDILLLLLYSPGISSEINEPIIGRTKLLKALFLFKKEVFKKFISNNELNEDNFYEFFAWQFGPFSADVYNDITFFCLNGFIDVKYVSDEPIAESAIEWNHWLTNYVEEPVGSDYQEEEFKLTSKGIDFTKEMYAQLSTNQKNILLEFKSKISKTPLRALLRYVYRQYPELTTKSIIKDDLLKDF